MFFGFDSSLVDRPSRGTFPTDQSRLSQLKIWNIAGPAILLIAAFSIWAIHAHWGDYNGTRYFRWNHRDMAGWWKFIVFAALSGPFFAAQLTHTHRPKLALAMVVISSAALLIAFSTLDHSPIGFEKIITEIIDPVDLGYLHRASILRGMAINTPEWLGHYQQHVTYFGLHARTKPPGVMLLETSILAACHDDPQASAAITALVIAVAVLAAIPATYVFTLKLTRDRKNAFASASYLSLCPSLLLLYPHFDQCFIVLAVGMVMLWFNALSEDSRANATRFGVMCGITFFISYLPMVLVFFCAALIAWIKPRHPIRLCAISAAGIAGFYLALYLATGFNPIAAFRACMIAQRENIQMATIGRHLPGTIVPDFIDFDLGAGWLALPLAIIALRKRKTRAIWLICIGQLVFVAVTGLIQCENARVWCFMLPMLMLPVGIELANWPLGWRVAVYAALLCVTMATWQSMTFFAY
jgi:hypothetical protein